GSGVRVPSAPPISPQVKGLSGTGKRAFAVSEGEVQQQSTAVARWNLSDQGCSRLTRKLFVKEYLFLSNISWTLVW
ncbi:MAG TPA: hypothetical protein VIJ07_22235, partial [Dermatophilaceae bacterium]